MLDPFKRPDLIILVRSLGHGRFEARHAGRVIVRSSRVPFFDAARCLVAEGFPPGAVLGMRHRGSHDVTLRARLGAAAKLTVDDHNASFANWQPFDRSQSGGNRPMVGPPMRLLRPEAPQAAAMPASARRRAS